MNIYNSYSNGTIYSLGESQFLLFNKMKKCGKSIKAIMWVTSLKTTLI